MDTQSLKELSQSYRDLPHGNERVEAIHSAITQADQQQDHYWRFHMRFDLMTELNFHGDAGTILPIITEMIAIYEEHSITDSALDYVYAIYICIGQWGYHPQLPLCQLDAMMEHFKKAVYQCHLGDESYHQRGYEIAVRQEKWQLAEQYYQKMLHPEFRDISSCAACQCYVKAKYFLMTNQKSKAYQIALPILDGTITCKQEPNRTYSRFLKFALDHETNEEATRWANLLRPHLSANEYEAGMLRWLAYNDMPKALHMLESGIAKIWGQWDQCKVFRLCATAWVVCLQYRQQSTEPAALTLPQSFPLWQESGLYPMDTLGAFFYEHAQKIAQAFDTRNGSHYYQTKLDHANHLGQIERNIP